MINIGVIIYGLIILILVSIFKFAIKKKKKVDVNIWREILGVLFGIYIIVLVSVTLLPIFIGNNHVQRDLIVNYIPIKGIIECYNVNVNSEYWSYAFGFKIFLRNVGGNFILLMPIAIIVPLFFKRFRNFKNIVLLGLIVSIGIEALQFIENYLNIGIRAVDIDDVILNTLGVAIGYGLYLVFIKLVDRFNFKIVKRSFEV
ncbi:Glycopeptide antibiotics resistance protein [Clostridium cavendishii DSM 21758]|uniref:Glycopeptide antibiotics resistance protein n=1 Tax=Clostridium cavendishii DSM 21758 TaxID=1121302 RepID=A0A1M6CAY1_9CLOT|nr:VanZ family protein [Clostridium cavendishii]SHI58182.1 Glycopeptide antibiotics resistance protein [Clostridium cavendishii DSM 21758]